MQGGELGSSIHWRPTDALFTRVGGPGLTGQAGLLHSTVKGIQALDQLAIADINPFHHQRKHPARQTCIAFRLGAVLRAVPIRTK